ncbi:pentatricopeptide repeat-containing protein At3g48250, chloroplastic [Rutidosis leptorrhynchoides]|uniref:pentatricopeptide repeat-containing protein At3g48250, chloroplastic n=1 Tax=Rutidosis leptorrhynchoides TaxID=125765 RepID=UPI003A99AC80
MNVTKRLLSSIRLTNSLYSIQLARTNSVNKQVITHLSSSNYVSPFLNLRRNLSFSSKPEPTLDLIVSENWSDSLEQELKSKFDFNHESVMYVLKKLSKDPKKASAFFNWVVKDLGFQPSSFVYGVMLRVYANKDSMKQFWYTVNKMKEQGYFIDDHSYLLVQRDFKNSNMVQEAALFTKCHNAMGKDNAISNVVKEIVRVVIESDFGNGVEKRLNEMKFEFQVSDNFVLRVLKDLRQYPLKALGFFKWVSENFGFKHDTVTYNGLLRVLGQEDSIQEFWSVFDEMKSNGHEMDLDTYLKITRLFQKRKMLTEAVELYERMMDSPYKPSVQDCSILLRTLAGNSSPNLDLVSRVVDKFKETGHSLSKSVYDGIHRSLTSLGQFDEAEKIMMAIKDAGYEPDNITYSQLIFGLCKARKLEEASKVIDLMEKNGCVPDVKTWTILIQGHCNANEVDKAVNFLTDMIEKGCEADADLLDVIINGLLGQNRVAGAYESLIEMVKTGGVKPWQATYKNLIQKLLEERKFDESLELLRLMKKQDYPPFSEPFVGYVSKNGTVDDALVFLKTVSFKEAPSVSAYQNLFQRLVDEGRDFDAKDLLYKCPPHIRKHKAISSLFGSVQSPVV